jgi:hypothetical protein
MMALTPNAKKEFRAQLVRYCVVAEKYEAKWHYTQQRPYTGLGAPASDTHFNDCSSYVAIAFYKAGRNSGHPIADPLGMHYSGWGFTGSAFDFLKAHAAPLDKYRIGDIAIYGTPSNTVHMTVCRIAGTGATATFSSFGQEAGPEPRKNVHYHPSPLLGVYRHPALL